MQGDSRYGEKMSPRTKKKDEDIYEVEVDTLEEEWGDVLDELHNYWIFPQLKMDHQEEPKNGHFPSALSLNEHRRDRDLLFDQFIICTFIFSDFS